MSFLSRMFVCAAFVAASAAALPARAGPFPEPTGDVILTIDGNIAADAPAGGYTLDMAGMSSLPAISFETSTIWTDGVHTFTGVSLKKLLEAAGANGTVILAEALNGYVVQIPIADLDDEAPILAYHIDGEEFSRRDKGPLWIIYPFDVDERYKTELSYANSVWQLTKLTIQ